MELHTDASRDDGVIGIAYVIRDYSEGLEIDGSQYIKGDFTSMEAEYNAMMSGIHAASWYGGDYIMIQTDCKPLVDKMHYPDENNDKWFQMRKDCHNILQAFDSWDMKHVHRSSNKHADRLAKEALWAGRDGY